MTTLTLLFTLLHLFGVAITIRWALAEPALAQLLEEKELKPDHF